MPRNAITMTPACMGRSGIHFLPESASGASRPYEAPARAAPGRREGQRFLGAKSGSPFLSEPGVWGVGRENSGQVDIGGQARFPGTLGPSTFLRCQNVDGRFR